LNAKESSKKNGRKRFPEPKAQGRPKKGNGKNPGEKPLKSWAAGLKRKKGKTTGLMFAEPR